MARSAPPPAPPADAPVFDTSPVKSDVQRVLVTDFAQIEWVFPLLQEDYGRPPMEWVIRQARMWSNDNQYSFIRT
ncbi:MAG: hypothetical protein KGL35_16285, partial [Bradyrhizobium sp.]|nr:hypothetical protein [Bradyrhizobium sp.]